MIYILDFNYIIITPGLAARMLTLQWGGSPAATSHSGALARARHERGSNLVPLLRLPGLGRPGLEGQPQREPHSPVGKKGGKKGSTALVLLKLGKSQITAQLHVSFSNCYGVITDTVNTPGLLDERFRVMWGVEGTEYIHNNRSSGPCQSRDVIPQLIRRSVHLLLIC